MITPTDTATALVASRAAGLSKDNRKHLIAAIAVAIEDAVAVERERAVETGLAAIYGHRPDASFDDSMAGAQERRALLSNVADEVAEAIRKAKQ